MAGCDALQGQGPGQGGSPCGVQHHRHQQGRNEGGPGDVRLGERGSELPAPGAHRPAQPWHEGRADRLYRQPEGLFGGHPERLPDGRGAEVHRASDTQFDQVRVRQGPKGVHRGPEADLPCRHQGHCKGAVAGPWREMGPEVPCGDQELGGQLGKALDLF